MKAFFRRFTWGFLPRGWGRLFFVIIPLIAFGISRMIHYIEYQDWRERMKGITIIGKVKLSFNERYPIELDILECLVISTVLSLIASWIADGFKKK